MVKEKAKAKEISRRQFLKRTGGVLPLASAVAGPFFSFPARSEVKQKKLKILQWSHFVPSYDKWFDDVFAKEWGRKYDTEVVVDHVPFWEIQTPAAAEIKTRKGHDLVMFPSPPARHEKYVIDHREIYKQVARTQGQMVRLAHMSTFNPKTKKYFAFSDSFMPPTLNYVQDYWEHIGYGAFGPTTYDTLRDGARLIRKSLGVPVGLGLAPEPDSNIALQSLLWSFGASVQDEGGNVTINSKGTLEALKYVKTLYQESGTPEAFTWKPHSNDEALLAGKVSCAVNAVSISRRAEQENPQLSRRIRMNPWPRGPVRWLACPHIMSCYAIWQFAENQEGAKQFLVDLTDNLGTAFKVSGFCNLPCFPKTVPDLKDQVESDPHASPPHKYMALEDALFWTTNIGYPGYATPAVDEAFDSFVIPRMFAEVAKGKLTPQDSASAAEKELKQIFEKWKRAEI
jgi:multiple sugar transport system substrate-binding protein